MIPVQDQCAVCEACFTCAGCEKHQRFTCASCGKLVPWSDGGADDRPMDCSVCWGNWWQEHGNGKVPSSRSPAFKKKQPSSTPSKKPPTKTEIARELGARINAHLKRFQGDPKINRGRSYDKAAKTWVFDERGSRDYFGAQSYGDRHRVLVSYVAYQGSRYLSIEDARQYLAWLDAGNVGTHNEVLR